MIGTIMSIFLSVCHAEPDALPVRSLDEPGTQQAIQQNLDSKFGVSGGTVTGPVAFSSNVAMSSYLTLGATATITGGGLNIVTANQGITFNDGTRQYTAAVGGVSTAAWYTSSSEAPSASAGSTFTITAGNVYMFEYTLLWNTTAGNLRVRFNGDEGNNYHWAVFASNGSATSGAAGGNSVAFMIVNHTSETVGVGETITGHFRVSTESGDNTLGYIVGSNTQFSSVPRFIQETHGGRYDGASAITSINIQPSAGTFTGNITMTQLVR